MKKLTLIACAVGVVAGGLATVAQAGQIQASATSYAREAINTDTLELGMPVVGYKLFGSVDASAQLQRFTIEVDLSAGTFGTKPTPAQVFISDQTVLTIGGYTADTTALNAAGTKLIVNFVIPRTPGLTFSNPIIRVNAKSTVTGASLPMADSVVAAASALGDGTIKGLGVLNAFDTTTNAAACAIGSKSISATVTHKDATGAVDDSNRPSSSNTANILNFPTTHAAVITANVGAGALNVANSNNNFLAVGNNGGTLVAAATGTGAITATLVNLGRVTLVSKATPAYANIALPTALQTSLGVGSDSAGGVNNYGLQAATGALNPAAVPGAGAIVTGQMEIGALSVDITADQGLAIGSTLQLNSALNCGAGTVVGTALTATAASGAAGVKNTISGQALAAFGQEYYVCYTVP